MNLNMKTIYVGSYSRAIQLIFDNYKARIIAYNREFDDPFETEVWEPLIASVEHVVDTFSLKKENKADTKLRNEEMLGLLPLLEELGYKVKACKRAGTITDSLGSFGLTAFRNSIHWKKIDAFHSAYIVTISKVNDNSEPLIDRGFTIDKINQLTMGHDNAWGLQDEKGILKNDIWKLSRRNRDLFTACLEVDGRVLEVLRSYAKAHGDEHLLRKATRRAVMSSIRPTPAKKPRIRTLKPGQEIVLRTGMNKRNVLQVKLLTNADVRIGLVELKTDGLELGTGLTFNVLMNLKTSGMLGSGRYVKLRNMDLNRKVKVRVWEVKVVGR